MDCAVIETIDKLIRRQATRGESVALTSPGRKPLNFRQLDELTSKVAAQLRGLGASRSHRLAMAIPVGPEAITCQLSVMRQAVSIPLNPASREAEFENDLARTKADCLLVDAAGVPAALKAARNLGIPVIKVRPEPDGPAGTFTLERGAELGPPTVWTEQQPDDVALIMQTSGTTGSPKRVPLTHANLTFSAGHSVASTRFSPNDRLLAAIPVHHIAGVTHVLITLISGSGLCCLPGVHAARFLDWMDEYRPTWIFVPPAVLRELVEHARRRRDVIERCSLRLVRSGASALPPQLLAEAEEAFQAPVIDVYGMTETAPRIACSPIPPGRRKPGSVGLPDGPEVMVMTSSGEPAAYGETGEILVRGPNVMRGYEDDPEANRKAFLNGWFRTGDLGWRDAEGYLFISGRIREQINRGGQKVSPAEVEAALARHAGVLEAVVFPMPHEKLGEQVAAAVVLRPGAETSERELRLFVTSTLADYKVPARIVFLPEIPKTDGGKIQRLELARMLGPRLIPGSAPAAAGFVAPANPVEMKLARIWREVLAVDRIGIHDDFFGLGGDSFSAALLLTEVQAEFALAGGDLERIDFLDTPTIASMAQAIERSATGCERSPVQPERLPVIALQPYGSGPPFFFVPWDDEDPFYLMPLARHLGTEQPFYVLRDPTPVGLRGVYSLEDVAGKFANAMRRIQPNGPYLLGGHCVGGIVAFEAARQLRAACEDVALLAIVDAPVPHYPNPVRHWRLYLSGFRFHFTALVRHRIPRAELADDWKSFSAHMTRLLLGPWERFRARRTKASPLRAELNVRVANRRAARLYRPAAYPGRIVTLDAKDHPQTGSPLDRRLGWSELSAQGIQRKLLNGTHYTIFKEPHVEETAALLNGLIGDASASIPGGHKSIPVPISE